MITEGEAHGALEIFDRRNLLEDLFETRLIRKFAASGIGRCAIGDTSSPGIIAKEPVHALYLER